MLERICRLDKLGIHVVSQRITPRRATLGCEIPLKYSVCDQCHTPAKLLGTKSRKLAHLPYGSRATFLNLRVPLWGCEACQRQWPQNIDHIAMPRCTLTRPTAEYALQLFKRDRLELSSVADIIGVTPSAARNAIAKLCQELHIPDPTRRARR